MWNVNTQDDIIVQGYVALVWREDRVYWII
jgi:hypothetical protein